MSESRIPTYKLFGEQELWPTPELVHYETIAERSSLYGGIQARAGDTTFLGYETTTADARVVAIIRDGLEYDELTGHGEAELVLAETPFYAEGGGQVGDQGVLRNAAGDVVFEVEDTQRPVGGLIVHRGMLRGSLRRGERLVAEVAAERRAATMRNHTGTHLLHRALRNVVGDRARQAGSLVAPDYLRFDFPFDRALTDEELDALEALDGESLASFAGTLDKRISKSGGMGFV